MKKEIEDRYLDIHNKMADQNGLTEKALWGSKESQEKRFQALSKVFLNNKGFTVIDYGCGLCHFYDFLLSNGFSDFKYIGIDINERFVKESKKKHPHLKIEKGGKLQTLEILKSENVDYLISSGIYNLGNNCDEVNQVFLTDYNDFFDFLNIGAGSNFLSDFSSKKDAESIYHNPFDLLEKCSKTISKNILYFHNYLPHDFTILMYKNHV